MIGKTKKKLLENWLNVPAIFNSHNFSMRGKIQYGVREIDVRGCSHIIPTRRKGIPISWLIEEEHRHYSGYASAFIDNERQQKRKYNDLHSDSITPKFWFVNGVGSVYKLITAHINRKNVIKGIAEEYVFFGDKFLYKINNQ